MNIPLLSKKEQDEANALKWWRESSEADKLYLWEWIQRGGGGPDSTRELISRFAQLGFTHIALLAERPKR